MGMELKWTTEAIREGFEKFFNEYGRYPTTPEIDRYQYLPSSKQLQRRFGSVSVIREQLGLPILDFTKGSTRSKTAKDIGRRGIYEEQMIYKKLVDHFGEVFVHNQKPFNNYAGRYDFYVYSRNSNFAIDVFYAANLRNLSGCINLKQKVYKDTEDKIILLSTNPEIKQHDIDYVLYKKDKTLPTNLVVYSLESFLAYIKSSEVLRIK
ncbi:MAG: hypothetical protein EXS68_00125 [Candidatus Ryanbacteria bacterium]|nr:hypothetical protein [Candidatus Ryanbacteria bacterium]